MTIPLFKKGVGERGPSSPSPLPDTAATAIALPESTDVSKAPTLRPPPMPSRPASSPPAEGAVERVGSGFTSVIRHLSLRGWLQWIYANGSDAMLRVRTRDGGNGNIWCRAGQIVDAEWGQLTPEAALHEILRLSSGSVTIDFDPVEREPRLFTPMHDLLQGGGAEAPRVSELPQLEAALAASSRGTASDSAGRKSSFSRSGSEPSAAHWRVSSWWPKARHLSPREYLAGGALVAALVLAFTFGRHRGSAAGELASASDRESAQQTKALLPPPSVKGPAAPSVSPAPRALSVIPFVVLEIEPANAEIWLDQARAGVGRLEIAPIPDGAMHELRFLAAGYQPRSLYFVGAPPAGRVVLERAADRTPVTPGDDGSKLEPSANAATEAATPDEPEQARPAVKSVPRRRAAAPAPPLRAREWAAPDDSSPAGKAAQVKASPQIQVIEARTPRVQVLD